MPLRNFLKLILPEQGVKVWTSIPKGGAVKNHFCTSIDELAEQILANDARGIDTYHACGTFVTAQNRRAANAGWFKVFFCDVDIGEGKAYATIEDAVSACDAFCNRIALLLPGMVRSGGGLHLYWPLDRTLTREEWLPLACRLKLLMQTHGFAADPARTADAASILRPPGTKNYKLAAPRDVTIDDPELFFEALSYEDIASCLLNSPCADAPVSVNNPLMSAAPPAKIKENANLSAGLPGSKAFDATVGAPQGCRGSTQLRYAGELVARGLQPGEVVARCMEWNQLCTPPQAEKEVRRIVASAFSMHTQKHPQVVLALVAEAIQKTLDMPFGFRWGNNSELMGCIMEPQKDGSKKEMWKVIAHLPIHLRTWLNEEGYKKNESYLFEHWHPLKQWQQFAMTTEDFNSSTWYAKLSRNGCSLVDGMDKLFKTYVRRLENMRRQSGLTSTLFSQFGWKDDRSQFLVGDDLCKPDGNVEQVTGNNTLSPIMRAMPCKRSGSAEEWTGLADGFCAPSLEAHLFMLQLSAAAPLMPFCVDEGNGGSIVSFVTEKSGYGKTPGALAAASIWGEKAATIISGNTTDNRLIDDITRRCHLPVIQEERVAGDPDYNLALIKKVSAGVNRSRLTSGGIPTDMPETFQTILMTISNNSLLDSVKRASGGDAMSKRIFEIELEKPDAHQLEIIGGLARDMMRHAGHAGRAIARAVVHPETREYIQYHLGTQADGGPGFTVRKYWDLLKTESEHRFIVWPIACAEVISYIMVNRGLLHFNVERQMAWVRKQARFRIEDKSGDNIIWKFSQFLTDHVDSCLMVSGPYDPKKGPLLVSRLPQRKIVMRREEKTCRLYIAQGAVHDWCTGNGTSFHSMGKRLEEMHIVLERSKLVTLGAGTGIETGRMPCWVVDTNHKELTGEESPLVQMVVDNDKAKAL